MKGMMWNAVERFSTQGIQFVLTIVIARLLSPEDYGLVAMIGIFMALAQTFIDSGFSNALIQKKDRTEADYCTMFYFNVFIALLLYALLFISAPWIARFYNQPQLVAVLRVLAISLVTNSLAMIQVTRLTIALAFKKLALISLSAVLASGLLAVWLATHGYGVWTLVFQTLALSTVWLLLLWLVARWYPRWHFSFASFHRLFSFGSRLLASNLLHTLYLNMYSLVIGKFFTSSTLGYFNRAYTLGQFPVQNFGNIVQKVLYPVQCRYQDDDEKFRQIFVNYLQLSSFILFPLMLGMSALARPLLLLLLTEKWLPAVPLLQIMCVSMMWYPIMQVNVQVLDAKGRSDYHLSAEIIKKILAVFILCATIPLGIYAVCCGMVFYSLLDIVVIVFYSRRLTAIGYKKQFKAVAPSFLLSAVMAGVVWGVVHQLDSVACQLLVGIPVGVVFYIVFAHILHFPELGLVRSLWRRDGECKPNLK